MEPLVLLPGMMCDGRLFGPQIEALGGERQVTVGDLTRSDRIDAIARDVLTDAPDRFALAGLSMGGIVAMAIMAIAPERVSRLALLDTNHKAELPERQALREPQITRALTGELDAMLREEMKPRYLAPENRADKPLLDLVLAMGHDLGPEVFARQSRALCYRPDYTATLHGINVPTLVLCGAHDALCPPARHQEIAGLVAGATIVIIEGAGHLPTLEQPETVNAALAQWFARASSGLR